MEAMEHGIKPTARKYGTTVKTVRKWVRFKLKQEVAKLQLAGKRKSASRLKLELALPVSVPTVLKILREDGLWRPAQEMVQTDNGTEFTAPWNSPRVTIFTNLVERCWGASHHRIPPGAKTYQSNVESFHRWIEEELYAAETFASEYEFLHKAARYQAWFNCTRYNSYKGDTPLHLFRKTYPEVSADALVFPPVVLDNLLGQYKDALALWAA
jgi:hypothetical protein